MLEKTYEDDDDDDDDDEREKSASGRDIQREKERLCVREHARERTREPLRESVCVCETN